MAVLVFIAICSHTTLSNAQNNPSTQPGLFKDFGDVYVGDAPDETTGEQFPSFSIDGAITGFYEHFDAKGDQTQSPYSFLDDHYFVEGSAHFMARLSRYEHVRGHFYGVWNQSDYRNSQIRDFIFERGHVEWEKGDAAIPFRVEAGDFFGYFSLRTLQRGLKGAQIDLQPDLFNDTSIQNSLLLFSGITDPIYHQIDLGQEVYSGGSYLISGPDTDVSVNYVHNFRERDSAVSLSEFHQHVASIAGERRWRMGDQALTFEFEGAGFAGDTANAQNSSQRNQQDFGLFGELRGRSLSQPVTYSVLYEHYGQEFQPRGASVSADRSTAQARFGWRMESGLLLRGRAQRFEDGIETTDPTVTWTGGLDLIGPFAWDGGPWPSLTGSISAYVSEVENRSDSTDRRTWSASSRFRGQVTDDVTAVFGGFYNFIEDFSADSDSETVDGFFGFDWTVPTEGFAMLVAPTMVVRRTHTPSRQVYDFGPRVGVDIYGSGHSVSADYAYLFQDGWGPSPTNIGTHRVSGAYSYTNGPHTFGIDAEYVDRNAVAGTATESYSLGAFYTLRFAYPHSPVSYADSYRPDPADGFVRLADLAPGLSLEEARLRLSDAGVVAGAESSGTLIYEVSWLPAIDQRQRLVIVHSGGRIVSSAVLISFDDVGSADSAEQVFERVRDAFARRYGSPSTYDEGTFAANFVDQINSDQLIRLAEWHLPEGVIRLGIPHRLDRTVQIEVQFSRGFPGPQQTRWGLSQVR